MTKTYLAFAAAFALPLATPASSQAPAAFNIATVRPISGIWSYHPGQAGSHAAFTDGAAARRLIIRCNRSARTVSVARTGVEAAAPTLAIWTSSSARSIPSRYLATKELIADLSASDPLLDAIAFSRGRFATGAAGAPMVAVTASPEVARVIEDCRS